MSIYKLYNGDCREVLSSYADFYPSSVDCIVTSPPYLKGKSYEKGVTKDEYWKVMAEVFELSLHLIKPSGIMFLNINGHADYPSLPFEFWSLCNSLGWHFVQDVIWRKRDATHYRSTKRMVDTKEFIFVFAGSENYNIFPERVMVRTEDTFGNRYGDRKPINNVWEITKVINNQFLKTDNNGGAFPINLPNIALSISCNDGARVLDPFMGTGTTGVSAVQFGYEFWGAEKEPDTFAVAEKRIKKAASMPSFFTPSNNRMDVGGSSAQQSFMEVL